jgi:hypothetical protein
VSRTVNYLVVITKVDIANRDISYIVVSLLFNLGATQRGRSVLFSDEQKLRFEGWKKGFVVNTKLDFMRRLLNLK